MTSDSAKKPLVSVIVAVRNGERYLSAAIDSVRAQLYRPLEVIVVDGHSSDNTAAIARSYHGLRYLQQPDRGIAAAYNLGISAAEGEFVAFLSHDDLWTPDKLQLQVEAMVRYPGLQFTVSRVKFFLEPGHSLPSGFRKELLQGDHVGYIMETLLARKALFASLRAFDTKMTTGEDVDWFARAKDQQVSHAVIPSVLVHKRVHDANSSLNDPATNQILLSVLRQSISRKRAIRENVGQH